MHNKATHLLLTISLAVVSLAGSGCGKNSSSSEERVKIMLTGATTVAALIAEIAKRYEQAHPNVRIDVQTGGSSRGINDPKSGLADIGMASRDLKENEQEGRKSHLLAQDGVCFIVHKSNPVNELSDEQILGIFTGKIDNWKEVGGNDAAITVINRAEGRSELELMMTFYKLKPDDFKADLISGENQHGLKAVAGDPNAITYMSVGASEFEAANGAPLKLLPLRGIAASSKTVEKGEFPLSRPLILVTKPEVPAHVQAFLDFAMSDKVHDLVRQQSYVPIQ